jgi:hygromycin-B 7''-O-kinase
MLGNWMAPNDDYSQLQAPDPVLTEANVLELVRRHVSASRVESVDESGGEARAYLVDDGVGLKVQRPNRRRPRTSLAKEAFFLERLAADPEISVPRVLGYGSDREVEYLCLTRMAGVPFASVELTSIEREAVLRALGQTLWRIHAIDQTPLRVSGLFPGDRNSADLHARLAQVWDRAVGAIQKGSVSWVLPIAPEALVQRLRERLPAEASLVALHSNPGPEHTFVDPDSHRFTGLIDFGDAYVSHPAFEVRWHRPEDRQALLAGYQSEATVEDDFLEVWQVILATADLTIMTSPRFDSAQQALARANLESLRTHWTT